MFDGENAEALQSVTKYFGVKAWGLLSERGTFRRGCGGGSGTTDSALHAGEGVSVSGRLAIGCSSRCQHAH